MIATTTINEEELRKLPRWARVAFAARCGRLVQPLLRQFWQNPHPQLLRAFDQAISLAEKSAAEGHPGEGLEEAVQAAQMYAPAMAGIAAMRAPGAPPARVPPADIVQYSVASTATAAALAAQATGRGDNEEAIQATMEAYSWAVHAANSIPVRGLDRVLQADLRFLQQATSNGQITEGTSVNSDFFALEKELRTFRRELPKLLEKSEGRFAVVHEDRVDGVWDTYEDALQAGYERYQLMPFLVKQVRAAEEVG